MRIGGPLKPGAPDYTHLANLTDCTNIGFERVFVHGSLDGDSSNDGFGIAVRNSKGVKIADSRFEQLNRGIVVAQGSDLTISNNSFRDIRSDGMQFTEASKILIDGNRLAEFHPVAGDHADAIQFFTKGTKTPSSGIRIINNVILQGGGEPMQGIFLRDEAETLPYRDVLIANNLVYANTYNGISVIGGGDGIDILNNTVLSDPRQALRNRIRMENVRGGRVEKNVADVYVPLGSSRLALGANLFLQDKESGRRAIPNARAGAKARVADLVVKGLGHQPAEANAWRRARVAAR